MALAEFVKFKEPTKYFDVDHALHAPLDLQHNDELSISIEPVLKGHMRPIEHGIASNDLKINFMHGTTCLAFKFKEGVIISVDSRASAGYYIASPLVHKVLKINKYLLGTMAGGAADCLYWVRVLSKQCRLFELRNKERISVAAASKLLSNILYNYKGYGLSLGTLIVGYDKMGPGLYYVDNNGTRLTGDYFSAGSGSPYAYSILDAEHRFDMTMDEAIELGQEKLDKFILPSEKAKPARILLVSDTHIGVRHNLIDRMRRHWLLNRAFKTAMNLYSPEVVIHLGDLLDQGFFEPNEDFNKDLEIVSSIFDIDQKSTVFKVIPGNHDVGFHHRLHPYTSSRFNRVFRLPTDQNYSKDDVEIRGSVKLWSYKGLLFVFLNSMAFEGDSCRFCRRAEDELQLLTKRLQCLRGELALQSCQEDFRSIMEHDSDEINMGDYTHPILIQHFPLFRSDETVCEANHPDSMPESERKVAYKPGIDCLSDSITRQLFFSIRPRLAFGGHSHYFCHRTHEVGSRSGDYSTWRVEEWTLPALSYRVSGHPGFVLVS
nr:hypothetical transcript [Hymenolepis microstoma]